MRTRGDTIGGIPLIEGVVMPYGVFPVPKRPASTKSGGPSLAVRIRSRFGRAELDSELANGADPAGSAELALRAEQLSSPAERARIANVLVETLGDARRGEPMTLRIRPQRAAVRAAADEILALALRLRDEQPAGVRGLAMAARLIDRSGPLYRTDAGDLDGAIASAHAALDATPSAASEPEARAA
jgi:hypothetical protein